MTRPTRAQLRELCERATPGPWKADLDKFDGEEDIQACITDDEVNILATIATGANYYPGCEYDKWTDEMEAEKNAAWSKAKESQALKDAAFIAAARTAVPALLDEVDALRALLLKARHTVAASMRQGSIEHRLAYREELLAEIDAVLDGGER